MQVVVLLTDEKLIKFCKEVNMIPKCSKVLIKINENKAEYYNFDDDCFYKLDMDIAKKYID